MNPVEELLNLARSQGFKVERTGGDHTRITNPTTGDFTIIGSTQTLNGHAMSNARRDLQRIGLKTKAEIRRDRRDRAKDERAKRAEEIQRHVPPPENVARRSEVAVMEHVETRVKRAIDTPPSFPRPRTIVNEPAIPSALPRPCPAKACKGKMLANSSSLSAHMQSQHPGWRKTQKRGGVWLSPKDYTAWRAQQAAAPEPAEPAPSDDIRYYAYVSKVTDYKFTNQPVHTDEGCPNARLRSGAERRLDLSTDVLAVVRWLECKECVKRRGKFQVTLTLTADECDALSDLLVAGVDELPELTEKLMRAVDQRTPLAEVA